MTGFLSRKSIEEEGQHWLSVSDLMAGLMVVFLFIAIALMRSAFLEKERIENIAVAYQEAQVGIYEDLMSEFSNDLEKWDAEIEQDTLTFVFQSPDILFEIGQTQINERYKALLSDFFPRYIRVLDHYRDSIDEVRIEGHTSSVWNRQVSDDKAYFLNMLLSQGRTRSVLEYAYSLPSVVDYRPWVKTHVAAVGLSSSRPILNEEGLEDMNASQRVTFRVITNSETRIRQILMEDENA